MRLLAGLIAGTSNVAAPGILVSPAWAERGASTSSEATSPDDAQDIVKNFDSTASPTAQRLARLLAATPLSLPTIDLVRQTMLPGATQAHVAEVFLGGLLDELASPGAVPRPDEVRYDFREGVREILLRTLRVSESLLVLRRVSRFVEEHWGQSIGFAALLADPEAAADWASVEGNRPFAQVAVTVLRPLGGKYLRLAERLTQGAPRDSRSQDIRPSTVELFAPICGLVSRAGAGGARQLAYAVTTRILVTTQPLDGELSVAIGGASRSGRLLYEDAASGCVLMDLDSPLENVTVPPLATTVPPPGTRITALVFAATGEPREVAGTILQIGKHASPSLDGSWVALDDADLAAFGALLVFEGEVIGHMLGDALGRFACASETVLKRLAAVEARRDVLDSMVDAWSGVQPSEHSAFLDRFAALPSLQGLSRYEILGRFARGGTGNRVVALSCARYYPDGLEFAVSMVEAAIHGGELIEQELALGIVPILLKRSQDAETMAARLVSAIEVAESRAGSIPTLAVREARAAVEAALRLSGTSVVASGPPLWVAAREAYQAQQWDVAQVAYQRLLASLDETDTEQRTEVYFQLGRIAAAGGERDRAVDCFERALALSAEHRPTLDALVALCESEGNWTRAIEYRRQILESVFDSKERLSQLKEIGDLWNDKVNNSSRAIEVFEEARDLYPEDHIVLHRLLALYQQTSDWRKVVDILDAIAETEKQRPEVKARYYFTQAQIYRDKLQDPDRAVEVFNEALDANADYLEAFERITKILNERKDWKSLERNYRKMLHRVAGKGKNELEYELWQQLGLVYRDLMGQSEPAKEALKMAATVKPEEPLPVQALAELHEVDEEWDAAIARRRQLLRADPMRVEAYRDIYRLYLHKQTYDAAWCLAAALAFLNEADSEERQFFEDYRPQGVLEVKGRLTDAIWEQSVVHPDQREISRILAAITPATLAAKIEQLRAQGKLPVLAERFLHDPATSTVGLAKAVGWAAQVLGVSAPRLFIRTDIPGGIAAVPALPPASVAGSSLLSGFQLRDLTFVCGHHIAGYREDSYIRTFMPSSAELTILLFAAVLLVAPQTPMPQDMVAQIRATAEELARHMQSADLDVLRVQVRRFLDEGAKANIKRWNEASELTACRAGLILCGDLEVARKILGAERETPVSLKATEKMKDLLQYFVSEEYFAVRRALGIAIAA
jgi:tetratricopeptide (TPR) repeat protein